MRKMQVKKAIENYIRASIAMQRASSRVEAARRESVAAESAVADAIADRNRSYNVLGEVTDQDLADLFSAAAVM